MRGGALIMNLTFLKIRMGLICYNAFATWQEQCHAEALGVLNSGHKEIILGLLDRHHSLMFALFT